MEYFEEMLDNPNLAVSLMGAGILAIYIEFCRPGRVVPGIAGGVAVLVGLASVLNSATKPSPTWVAIVATPVICIGLWLLSIAIRARSNKRSS
jgi:membrane-bound ClpP family serine protease